MNRAAGPRVAPALCALLMGERRAFALGAALAVLTVALGIGLLGLSGWFITAASLAGLQATPLAAVRNTSSSVSAPSESCRSPAAGRRSRTFAGGPCGRGPGSGGRRPRNHASNTVS